MPFENTHLTYDGVAVAGFVLAFAVTSRDIFDRVFKAVLGMAIEFLFSEFGFCRDVCGGSNDGTSSNAHGDGAKADNSGLKRDKYEGI